MMMLLIMETLVGDTNSTGCSSFFFLSKSSEGFFKGLLSVLLRVADLLSLEGLSFIMIPVRLRAAIVLRFYGDTISFDWVLDWFVVKLF